MAPGDDRMTRSKKKSEEAGEKKTPPPHPPKRKIDEQREGNTPPQKKKTPPPKRTKLSSSQVIETLAPKHPSAAGLSQAELNRKIKAARNRARARGRDLPAKGLSRLATQSLAKYHHSDAKYGGTTPDQTSFFPEVPGATTDGTFRPIRTSGVGAASQATIESPTTQAAHDLLAREQLQSENEAFQRNDDAYRHAPAPIGLAAPLELNPVRNPPTWPGVNQYQPPAAVTYSSPGNGGGKLPSLRNDPMDSPLPQATPYFHNKPGHGSPFVRDQPSQQQQQQQQPTTPQPVSAQRAMADFASSRRQGEIYNASPFNSAVKKSTPKSATPKIVQFNEDVKTNDGPGRMMRKRKAEPEPERSEDESSVISDEDETFTSLSPAPNPSTPEVASARFQQASFRGRGGISRPTFSSMRPAQSQAPQVLDESMSPVLPSDSSPPGSPPTPELPSRNTSQSNLESPDLSSPFAPALDHGLGLPEFDNSRFHPGYESPMPDATSGEDTMWEELLNLSSPVAASTPAATRRSISTGVSSFASKLATVQNAAASEPQQTPAATAVGHVSTASNTGGKDKSTSGGAAKSVKCDEFGPVDDNIVICAPPGSPQPAEEPVPDTCDKRCQQFKAQKDAMEWKYVDAKQKADGLEQENKEHGSILSAVYSDQNNARSRDAANIARLSDENKRLRAYNASLKPQIEALQEKNDALEAVISTLMSTRRSSDTEIETMLKDRNAALMAELEDVREIAEVIQAVIVDDEDVPGDEGATGQATVPARQVASPAKAASPEKAASPGKEAGSVQAPPKDPSVSDMDPNQPYEDTDDFEATLGLNSDSSSGSGDGNNNNNNNNNNDDDDDKDDNDDDHPAKQDSNDRRPPGGGGGSGAPGGGGGGDDDDKSSGRPSSVGRGAKGRGPRKAPSTSFGSSQGGSDRHGRDSVDNCTQKKDVSLLVMFSKHGLENAHRILNSKHDRLQSDYRGLQEELKQFQTLQSEHRELKESAQRVVKKLQRSESELKDRLAVEMKSRQGLQDLQVLRDIVGVKNDERNSTITDKLHSLDGRVRQLASRLCHARAVMPVVEETTKIVKKGKQTKKTPAKSDFDKLAEETCADWMSFRQAGSWQNLIHAVMWKHLEDQLFNKPFEYWAKQFGGYISKLLTSYTTDYAIDNSRSGEANDLRVPRANVCRALLAQMLHERNSDQNKNTGLLISGLAKLLTSIFPKQSETSIDIEDESTAIIEEAIEVMALLAQSPAHYELDREFLSLRRNLTGDRLLFDGASMIKKAENVTDQAGVDVVMCPALMRRGPEDGLVGSYEDQTLVGSATVTADGGVDMTDAYEDYAAADDELGAQDNQVDNSQAGEDATTEDEIVEEKTGDVGPTPTAPETPGLRRSTRAPKKPKQIIDPDETDA